MVPGRGITYIVILAVSLAISWIFVSLRIYVRCYTVRQCGSDDWFLIATLVAFTVDCAFCIVAATDGLGEHLYNLSPDQLRNALLHFWVGECLYVVTTILLRLSIAIFLRRTVVREPAHLCILYTTVGIIVALSIAFLFFTIFQCSPPSYYWNYYSGGSGTCLPFSSFEGFSIAYSATSAITDFIFAFLPAWIIWHLQMDTQNKITVVAILSLGLFATAATVIRIPYLSELTNVDDFTHRIVPAAIWSILEPAVGLVAASCFTLRPLFKCFYQSARSVSRRGFTSHQRVTRLSKDTTRIEGKTYGDETGILEKGESRSTAP